MHGHLRATRHLDLLIGLHPDNCAKAMDALSGIGLRSRLPVTLADFADPSKREDWARNRNMGDICSRLWSARPVGGAACQRGEHAASNKGRCD